MELLCAATFRGTSRDFEGPRPGKWVHLGVSAVCQVPDNLEELENSLTDFFSRGMRRHPNIVIAGDFNPPDIDWANLEVNGKNDAINARKLLGMVDQFGLTQHQLEVTRPASGNTLDLVLCSNPNLVKSVEVVPGCAYCARVIIWQCLLLSTYDPNHTSRNHTRSSCIVRLTLMVSAETCPISRCSSCLQGWTAAHKMLTEVGSALRMLSHQPSKSTSRHGAPNRNVAHRGSQDPSNLNSEERIVATVRHVVHERLLTGLPTVNSYNTPNS